MDLQKLMKAGEINKMYHTMRLMPAIILTGVIASLTIPVIGSCKAYKRRQNPEYQALLKQAEPIADKLYGNNDGILSDDERKNWYKSIDTQFDTPTIEQLKTFNSLGKSLDDKIN
ncbi:Uncharacterised protein [uncultured archaeon]|nr:Uncharacterised protein [uncultured archaeon]